MFTIGESIRVQDVPRSGDVALVTNKLESAIVREYTFEELLLRRSQGPEVLGSFAHLSTDELYHELLEYESFLVEVGDGDYRLVIGFPGAKADPRKGPTILYAECS
jgi:hypothetical protein